jgi:hypothetical protein
MYYVSNVARPDGTYLIYDETIMTKVRNPKPIGIVVLTEGKKTYRFLPSEKAKWK